MVRAKFIPSSDAEEIPGEIVAAREDPKFEPLRHFVAHGPHLGLGKGGWLDASGHRRYWEFMALNHEDGEEMLDSMFTFDLERRDQRAASARRFVGMIVAYANNVCRRLCDLAEANAEIA
jgi:hypothetical protein